MTTRPGGGPLVVGLGSPDRGDDAVGPAVARGVAARRPDVAVVEVEEPTALLDLWAGHDPVVVVDSVRSGAPTGSVHRLETGQAAPPLAARSRARSGPGSTHAVGLAEMVELGRALGRLPQRLVVVGVEAEHFDHGAPMTPLVAAAVPDAVLRVCDALTTARREEAGDVPR